MQIKYKHTRLAASNVASHITVEYYGPLRTRNSFMANLFHNTWSECKTVDISPVQFIKNGIRLEIILNYYLGNGSC